MDNPFKNMFGKKAKSKEEHQSEKDSCYRKGTTLCKCSRL